MRTKPNAARPAPKVFGAKPRPHHGRTAHGIRPGLFYGMFAALFATNMVTFVGLVMAPDVAKLFGGQATAVAAAYEDRIAQLRVEVDRLHSRQFAQTGDINLQLQELSQQQEVLLEQHQLVRQLAEKAEALGLKATALPPASDDAADTGVAPAAYMAAPRSRSDELAEVGASMSQMMQDSRMALAALGESATESTDAIVTTLGALGIRPKLPDDLGDGVGGPLLPPQDGEESSSIVDDANQVYLALARFKAARGAIDAAPIHKPLDGYSRISSGYGNRKDPFTGGRAYHSGIDFSAPRGTLVLSAGYGKVSFVGERSGYGNVVEVTHANGLVSRYGHLSAFLVKEGQVVATGTPIAKVGSTGRSTGPHLHFEVRRKDSAVDPSPYLAAGRELARFLGASV